MRGADISVIIPAYDASATIGRALESVFAQSEPPGEVVVVDDGSRDDLDRALRPFGGRVALVRQPNGGAAAARNRGIAESRRPLLAFLDADDTWEPAKLERQLAVLGRHPEVGLVASHYYWQEPGGPRAEMPRPPGDRFDRVLDASGAEAFEVALAVSTITVLVRRIALADCRFDPTLPTAEDRDLWVRLLAANRAYILSEPLATAIHEPGSLSRGDADRDYASMLRVVRRHGALLGPRELGRWEAEFFRRWAAVQLGEGRAAAARAPASEYLRRRPLSAEAWRFWLEAVSPRPLATAGRRLLRRPRGEAAAG